MSDGTSGARQTIRQYVLEKLDARGFAAVGDADSLVEGGVADSLGVIQMVAFLEETFGIRIGDHEIVQDNFRTVDALVHFVTVKTGKPA